MSNMLASHPSATVVPAFCNSLLESIQKEQKFSPPLPSSPAHTPSTSKYNPNPPDSMPSTTPTTSERPNESGQNSFNLSNYRNSRTSLRTTDPSNTKPSIAIPVAPNMSIHPSKITHFITESYAKASQSLRIHYVS